MMFKQCTHYDCNLRNNAGYCKSTTCINPSYNNHEISTVIKQKPKTNADRIRSMTDEELAEWYWWMLSYVQGYTDSKLALSKWLKEECEQ